MILYVGTKNRIKDEILFAKIDSIEFPICLLLTEEEKLSVVNSKEDMRVFLFFPIDWDKEQKNMFINSFKLGIVDIDDNRRCSDDEEDKFGKIIEMSKILEEKGIKKIEQINREEENAD